MTGNFAGHACESRNSVKQSYDINPATWDLYSLSIPASTFASILSFVSPAQWQSAYLSVIHSNKLMDTVTLSKSFDHIVFMLPDPFDKI